MTALRPEHCTICGEYPGVGVFCSACGVLSSHPTSGDYAASYLRRLSGELLDLLIFFLLPLWLYWMWFTAKDGQSPAKSLLDLYVVNEAGQEVTPQRMWVRELAIKRLLLGLVGYGFSLLGPILNAAWILFNPDRQCGHDRMVGTLVIVRREAPTPLAQREEEEERQAGLRLPPPAPRGPRVKPPPRRTAGSTTAAPKPQSPPPRSPELEALEQKKGQLSQAEYERRRRRLLRQLEEKR